MTFKPIICKHKTTDASNNTSKLCVYSNIFYELFFIQNNFDVFKYRNDIKIKFLLFIVRNEYQI